MADEIVYRPRPGFQERALISRAQFLLVGGEAGPGKTWFLCYDQLFDFHQHLTVRVDGKVYDRGVKRLVDEPQYCGVILRRESTQLEKVKAIATPLYGAFGGEWRGQPKNCFVFRSGAHIYLRHMNNVDDWQQFQGWEIHTLSFDELTQFEELQFTSVLPWVRSTVDGLPSRVRASCNPEGRGLDFVKRWWNIRCPCKEHKGSNGIFHKEIDVGNKVVRLSFEFIPGERAGSFIEEHDPDYEGRLALQCGGMDSPRFRAIGRGCWEVGKGAFFGEFCGLHVIPNDWQIGKGMNWSYVLGHDHATSPDGDASAGVLLKVNERRDIVVEDERFGWGASVEEQARRLADFSRVSDVAFSGSDIFWDNQAGEIRDVATQFRNLPENPISFVEMKYDRANMASIIRSALNSTLRHGRGMNPSGCLYVRERCARLIDDFYKLMTDEKDFEVWDTGQRITVNGKKYHFDVFNAFVAGFKGARTTGKLPEKDGIEIDERRRKSIRKINSDEKIGNMSCAYPI